MRHLAVRLALPLIALVGLDRPAHAQYIDSFLPSTVPGFDTARGVTVTSRQRTLYNNIPVHLGSFFLTGSANEQFGYNSNVTGTATPFGSALNDANISASASSNFSRNRLGISASADKVDYLSASRLSHTDYNFAVGGGYTIYHSDLNLGYSHVHGNEFGGTAGAISYGSQVPFDVDVVRSSYSYDAGRITLTPNIDARLYQYGAAVTNGVTFSQNFRDRTLVLGGVTGQYALADQRAAVLVVQGARSDFLHPTPGAPSNNSQSLLILPGLDYQDEGPWRYRVLVGGEYRTFASAQYGSRLSPIFEGSVIYTPTGLTTLTLNLRREIEDTQAEGTGGFTSTNVDLRVDHELRRNVLLNANVTYSTVKYFQQLGGSSGISFGGSANYLIDNHLSAYANYGFTHQDASNTGSTVFTLGNTGALLSRFTQHVALIGLRWRL